MKMQFTNDWLRRKIETEPDVDCEAGPEIFGMKMIVVPDSDSKHIAVVHNGKLVGGIKNIT
jgi:hypothetical protein